MNEENQFQDSPKERISIFGYEIDPLTLDEAVEEVYTWINEPNGECRFVVTPNVDHTVMLQTDTNLRRAYEDAHLILADGFPVVMASRMVKKPLPERVPGSDLTPALFAAAEHAERPIKVFLLGAAEGVADVAAMNIEARFPNVNVVKTYSPPIGFHLDEEENQRIIDMIAEAQPDILVVGLGAPKQELWVHRFHQQIAAPVALCVGATIDFLAGEVERAPEWVQKIGMEWCHRMMADPKRLARRYAKDAWHFPQIVWREWWYETEQA